MYVCLKIGRFGRQGEAREKLFSWALEPDFCATHAVSRSAYSSGILMMHLVRHLVLPLSSGGSEFERMLVMLGVQLRRHLSHDEACLQSWL